MVKIIQDPRIVRLETYRLIDNFMYPHFYLEKAGAGALIYSENGTFVGELFLSWGNKEITITGDPLIFLDISNKLEHIGFKVVINSPYKITSAELIN